MTENLFISDLHLSVDRPGTVQLFLEFLVHRAPNARSLYILGDLFDAWIGDDVDSPPIPQIKNALRKLTDSGTQVFIMHGNRDFLIGKGFSETTGIQLLDDPTLLQLEHCPTLLMHGDLLCTDDQAYQSFRKQIRDPAFIQQFLSLSIPKRLETAADYRSKSGEANSMKPEEIMDVNQQTVEKIMREYAAIRLIHGHTHRPGLHEFILDGKQVKRHVLAEWHANHAEILSVSPEGWRTEIFSSQ